MPYNIPPEIYKERTLPDGRVVSVQLLVMGTGRIGIRSCEEQMFMDDVW